MVQKVPRGLKTMRWGGRPKGAKKWNKLPPELHEKAEQMFNEIISRPEYQEDLRQGKWWRIGLVTANVTETLLRPKDSKWSRSIVMQKAVNTKLARYGPDCFKQWTDKARAARKAKKNLKAGTTKVVDLE